MEYDSEMLTEFTDNIWTCQTNLKMYGVELGTRMTVIDLDGKGSLFIHSPVKLTPELKVQIDRIGQVQYIVAPNKWHHLFVADFKNAYPNAQFFCAPGLEKKRSDFPFDAVIGRELKCPWNESLEHKLIDGVPIFNEVVFFHPSTKTLVLTDLAIHICETNSLLTKIIFKLLGAYGKFGWAKLEKLLYIRDRALFRASLENILLWDFEKILVTHGDPIETNGKQRLKDAFSLNH